MSSRHVLPQGEPPPAAGTSGRGGQSGRGSTSASGPRGAQDASEPAARPRPTQGRLLPGFLQQANQQRAKLDCIIVCVVGAAMTLGVYRQFDKLSAWGLALHGASLALSLLLTCWATLRPASYAARRELLAAALRLAFTVAPVAHLTAEVVGARLGGLVLESPGLGGALAFLAGLIFCSHGARMALLGLGLPLRAPAHVALQLALVLAARAQNPAVCAAVLHLGSGAAGTAGGAGSGSTGGAHAPAAAVAAAEEAAGLWFTAVSSLALWLPLPLAPPSHTVALQQCLCLLTMSQVALGFLLPAGLHVLLESKAYCSYRKERQAQQQGQQQGAGGGAGEVQHGGGPAAADAPRSGGNDGSGELKAECLLERLYCKVWAAAEAGGLPLALGAIVLLAGGAWEAVTLTEG